MTSIRVISTGQTATCAPGQTLLSCLLSAGVFVENPCGGKGTCGKCKVRVVAGEAPAPTDAELRFLSDAERARGIRLACMVEPAADLSVELLEGERGHRVLSSGYVPDFEFAPIVRRVPVEVVKPSLEDQTPLEDQLRAQVAQAAGIEPGRVRVPLGLLAGLRFVPGRYDAVAAEDADGGATLLDLWEAAPDSSDAPDASDASAPAAPDTSAAPGASGAPAAPGTPARRLLGAAIDIGTTTVVVSLVDLESGEELASASDINAQKAFGQDVLTRIGHEVEHPQSGAADLQAAIVGSIDGMLADVCAQAGAAPEDVYALAVGANCTMMHMLLGVDARPIGKSPYAPVFAGAQDIRAAEIGLRAAARARLYCLPAVSAYIGADIVAGAQVCGLAHPRGNVLFIDIGTNGEIVFSHDGRLLCCSCAAGPALEGMNISCGMRAAEGAVEDVSLRPGGCELSVIGDAVPKGLCGSGILAALRELLACGLVRTDGAFVKPDALGPDDWQAAFLKVDGRRRSFDAGRGISVTQADVRQVQLAKGAILSGFYALLDAAGVDMEELDRVLIAGQFGAHLPAESLVGTGILPPAVADRIEYVGNTSKTGALLALLSAPERRGMEELARHMDYMELGAVAGYDRLLADCMAFPAPGGEEGDRA